MVRTTVDSNPLDPTYAQKRTSIDGSEKKNISTRRMSDLESIVKDSQNVAP